MKIKLLVSFLFLFSTYLIAQTNYTYIDPCSGTSKTIIVPSNGITMSYYGQVKTFSISELQTGIFDTWANSLQNQYGNSYPCAGVTIVSNISTLAQTTANNILNIVNSVSAVSSVASSASSIASSASNVANGASNISVTDNSTSTDIQIGNTDTNNTGVTDVVGSSGTIEGASTSDTNSESDTGSSSSGSNNKGSNSSKSGKANKGLPKPTIIANSDFTGFYFVNANQSIGGKFSGGYTAVRWDGLRTYGFTFDYITAMGGGNLGGFYAFLNPNRVDIFSTAVSIGYVDSTFSTYLTLSAGQLFSFKTPKSLKLMYMISGSYGITGDTKYISTATILGGMYDFKITNQFSLKTTLLYVYAPYIIYYEDYLLKSPHVILPIIGTNINITNKFKLNVNFGTVWPIGSAPSSYSLLVGTRLML